jgi:glutathione S-transferase
MVKYDLYYVNSRGRAEIARLLFHAAGVEFNDHRNEFSDFKKLVADSPLGAIPWLEVDGVKLPQSIALSRFLAREFKLDGNTSLDKAKADVVVDTCLDLINSLVQVYTKTQDGPERVN